MWLRLIEMGTTESKAKSLGALLQLVKRLKITSKYADVRVQQGLFGWEVGLIGWGEDENTFS